MSTTRQARQVTDMMGRTVNVPVAPKRIISLVPSQTELIADLGMADCLVGITKFCVHPDSVFRTLKRVGGTKHVDYEAIASLEPDLILANKEENTQEIVETLAQNFPVWVSDIQTVDDGLLMIEQVGDLLDKELECRHLTDEIRQAWLNIAIPQSGVTRPKVAYLIWQNPIMLAGRETFIHDTFQRLGFENVALTFDGRYPQTKVEQLQALSPTHILLSSEPFPFKDKHLEEWRAALPKASVTLVDGEMFSWYGSRMRLAVPYFKDLLTSILK